jgi:hypothetical protein
MDEKLFQGVETLKILFKNFYQKNEKIFFKENQN